MTKSAASLKPSSLDYTRESIVAEVIRTEGLRKTYGTLEALRGLDLRVSQGSIHGFLGRNGAGKSTTMKTLLGMVHATSGSAAVLGHNALDKAASVEIRKQTAFVTEEKEVDPSTVDEAIAFTASFYPTWRKDLEQTYRRKFELRGDQKVSALSRGTRTKLSLLLALSRGVKLLMLDEPTAGLDPAVSEEVLQALVSFTGGQEATIFFSSHQIPEVEQIADSVTIIDHGRTALTGSLDDIRSSYCRIQFVFDGRAPQVSFRSPGIVQAAADGRSLSVLSSAGSDRAIAEAQAWNPTSVEVHPVTLKEIFLSSIREEA
jgi:ABC-2 type transport system ATP-binding protein